MRLWQGGDAAELFRAVEREAFHLEVRDAYAEPAEHEPLRRFLDGQPELPDPTPAWRDLMRETTGRGVTVSRVRVVTVPHSDYTRWLLSITHRNVDAGDDIRYLPRHLAGDVPPDDWWIFDEQVAFNLSDVDGKPAGLAITTDPQILAYCQSVKRRLWAPAVPYVDYLGSTDSQR